MSIPYLVNVIVLSCVVRARPSNPPLTRVGEKLRLLSREERTPHSTLYLDGTKQSPHTARSRTQDLPATMQRATTRPRLKPRPSKLNLGSESLRSLWFILAALPRWGKRRRSVVVVVVVVMKLVIEKLQFLPT